MKILETGFEEPLLQQVVCNNANSLIIADLLAAKAIDSHLIEALAELANSIRNDRYALKHLTSDGINNVEQLDKHLFVECLFTLSLSGRSGIIANTCR